MLVTHQQVHPLNLDTTGDKESHKSCLFICYYNDRTDNYNVLIDQDFIIDFESVSDNMEHYGQVIYTVLLTRSLAHCSCSWPTQLDQTVLAAYTCSSSPTASTKLKFSII